MVYVEGGDGDVPVRTPGERGRGARRRAAGPGKARGLLQRGPALRRGPSKPPPPRRAHQHGRAAPPLGCAPLHLVPATKWTPKLFWQMAAYVSWILASVALGAAMPSLLEATSGRAARARASALRAAGAGNYSFCPKQPVASYGAPRGEGAGGGDRGGPRSGFGTARLRGAVEPRDRGRATPRAPFTAARTPPGAARARLAPPQRRCRAATRRRRWPSTAATWWTPGTGAGSS
jgi:hypothetical protein